MSFISLLKEAEEMLLDRSREEADLIYYVCMLDDECRAAIIFAYKNLFLEDK